MRFIITIAALAATALAAPQYGTTLPRYPWGRQQPRISPGVVTTTTAPQQGITLTNSNGQPVSSITLGNGQTLPTTVIVSDSGVSNNNNDIGFNDGYGNTEPNTIVLSGNGVSSTSIAIT